MPAINTNKTQGNTDSGYFDLIFTGQILSGKTEKQVISSLQKIFQKDAGFIEKLFSKTPLIIKRNVPQKTADKYQMLFAKAGCEVILKQSLQLSTVSGEKEEQNSPSVQDAIAILRGSILPDAAEIKTTPLPLSSTELFLRFSITAILSTFIIGLFSGPKKIFGYIAERIEINGDKLQFENRWAFFIPFSIFTVGSYLYTLLFSMIYQHLYTTSIKMIIIGTEVFFFPFPAGIAVLVFLNMLVTSTTLNGFTIGAAFFQNDFRSVLDYINDNAKKTYMLGVLAISSLFGGAPFFIAIIFKEWFNNLEIHGKRYKVSMPWDIIIAGTIFNFLTLGIYIFKLVSDIHIKMHQNSSWEDTKPTDEAAL